jgi:hypothetical protein
MKGNYNARSLHPEPLCFHELGDPSTMQVSMIRPPCRRDTLQASGVETSHKTQKQALNVFLEVRLEQSRVVSMFTALEHVTRPTNTPVETGKYDF